MAQTVLTCEEIGKLHNGVAGEIIDREIALAVADLADRGDEDKTPREVTIKLSMAMHEGLVVVKVAAKAKLPERVSGATVAQIGHNKGQSLLWFQDGNAERPDQPTFPAMDVGEDGEIRNGDGA